MVLIIIIIIVIITHDKQISQINIKAFLNRESKFFEKFELLEGVLEDMSKHKSVPRQV